MEKKKLNLSNLKKEVRETQLGMLKEQIKVFWSHYSFFHKMIQTDRDSIMNQHFYLLEDVINPFWDHLEKYYEYSQQLKEQEKKDFLLQWQEECEEETEKEYQLRWETRWKKEWSQERQKEYIRFCFERDFDRSLDLRKEIVRNLIFYYLKDYTLSNQFNEEIRINRVVDRHLQLVRKGIQKWWDPFTSFFENAEEFVILE